MAQMTPSSSAMADREVATTSIARLYKYPVFNKAMGYNEDMDLQEPDSYQKVDQLLTELIAMKEDHSNNNVTLSYVDHRNGKDKNFVKIPQVKSDASFRSNKSWVKACIEKNSFDARFESDGVRRD